jgi:hypothetical protein
MSVERHRNAIDRHGRVAFSFGDHEFQESTDADRLTTWRGSGALSRVTLQYQVRIMA